MCGAAYMIVPADEIEEREASGQDQKKQKSQTACSLLEWARAVCAGSQLRVPVQNFTTSFADGRALCALLNFYHPQLLSTGDMQTTTADLAIKKGKSKKSGSSSTFSATEMWCPELLSSGDISQVEYQRCLEGERHNFVLFNKSNLKHLLLVFVYFFFVPSFPSSQKYFASTDPSYSGSSSFRYAWKGDRFPSSP